MATTPELFGVLRNLAQDIGRSKTAAANPPAQTVKKADGPTPKDPGGYQGASSHPSAKIDNNVQNSSTGARASENTSDIKADQGAPSVDSTAEAKHQEGSGSQDEQQLNIGTQQSATGEDPSVEDDFKGDKDDPGTTSPVKASIGEKYGSVKFAEAKKTFNTLADEILADLVNGYGSQLGKQAAAKPAAPATPAATPAAPAAGTAAQPTLLEKAAAAVKSPQAAAINAGYELCTQLGIKQAAAAANVQGCLEETVKDADLDATLFANAYRQFTKRAGDGTETDTGEDHGASGDSASGAGDGGGSAAPPSGSSEGGGGDAGGGGGESLGDLLGGGGDPGGMMAGPPPAAGGGLGEGDKTMALQQLVAALMELGISPEELASASAPPPGAGGAGAPPGAPPGAGGPSALGGAGAPPPDAGGAPPMSEGMKLASVAKDFQRSGKFAFAAADRGTPERELRDQMKGYILEQMSMSTGRRAA